MSLLDEVVSVPRRTMTLFFMIDTSGSMMDGETELVYIGKVAKVKLVTSNELK